MNYIHNTVRGDERQSQSPILLPQSQIEMNAFKADYSHIVTAIDVPIKNATCMPMSLTNCRRPLNTLSENQRF